MRATTTMVPNAQRGLVCGPLKPTQLGTGIAIHTSVLTNLHACQRNLCAVEWVKSNPQGTTDEFKTYFSGLSEGQKQVCYVFYSSQLCILTLFAGLGREIEG